MIGLFSGHCNSSTWRVSFSLAQVSEFSFVLASRARQLRIISREVYIYVCSIGAMYLEILAIKKKQRHAMRENRFFFFLNLCYIDDPLPTRFCTTPITNLMYIYMYIGLLGDPEYSRHESPSGSSSLADSSTPIPIPANPSTSHSPVHLHNSSQILCKTSPPRLPGPADARLHQPTPVMR